MESLDKTIFYFVNNTLHSEPLNFFFKTVTDKKFAFIPIILILLIIYRNQENKNEKTYLGLTKRSIYIILGAALATGLADLISSRLIKPLVARPRPCKVLDHVYYWKKKKDLWLLTTPEKGYKSSYSFTSSHAANSMAMAFFIGLYYRKYLIWLISFSLLIGISRLYVGVHYPSDVIGGFCVGIFMALWIKYLLDFFLLKREIREKKRSNSL